MKRFFAAILCSIGLLSALSSCAKRGEVAAPGPVEFVTLQYDSVCPLFRNYAEPACHITLKLAVPVGAPELERTLVTLPREGALAQDSGGTMEGMARAYLRQFIFQYLLDGKEAIDSYNGNTEEAGSWMTYEEAVQGVVTFNANGFVCYEYSIYSFAGGAHGNTQTRTCVFDLRQNRALQLADFFEPAALGQVADQIRARLMLDANCTTLEQLAEAGYLDPEGIGPTENFLIDNDGIIWLYDPYEIAPYSMGEIEVPLPWRDVLPLIKAETPLHELAEMFAI